MNVQAAFVQTNKQTREITIHNSINIAPKWYHFNNLQSVLINLIGKNTIDTRLSSKNFVTCSPESSDKSLNISILL